MKNLSQDQLKEDNFVNNIKIGDLLNDIVRSFSEISEKKIILLRNCKKKIMKLSSLNIRHAKLLDKYVKYLQGVAYEATEFSTHKKFDEFNEILYNIATYTNAFRRIVKNSKSEKERVG